MEDKNATYEAPEITELGTVQELTLQNKALLNTPDGIFFNGLPLTSG
jgi:hypothetical protein